MTAEEKLEKVHKLLESIETEIRECRAVLRGERSEMVRGRN